MPTTVVCDLSGELLSCETGASDRFVNSFYFVPLPVTLGETELPVLTVEQKAFLIPYIVAGAKLVPPGDPVEETLSKILEVNQIPALLQSVSQIQEVAVAADAIRARQLEASPASRDLDDTAALRDVLLESEKADIELKKQALAKLTDPAQLKVIKRQLGRHPMQPFLNAINEIDRELFKAQTLVNVKGKITP